VHMLLKQRTLSESYPETPLGTVFEHRINVGMLSIKQVILGIASVYPFTGYNPLSPVTVLDPDSNITYNGIRTSTYVEEFLNIQYAHDTSGGHRFSPPRPYIPSSNSIINATFPGAACPQPHIPLPADPYTVLANVSEDCLTLRIARPAGTGTTRNEHKSPVMVFIYGGGGTVGTIYDGSYDPVGLIRRAVDLGTPMVYVAMNYRVNCTFLPHYPCDPQLLTVTSVRFRGFPRFTRDQLDQRRSPGSASRA
jgi:hypothetical protein